MTKVMLHMHDSFVYFWAKAIDTTCYIANRVFPRSRIDKTCYELWLGRKSNLKDFRTFGSQCYIFMNRENLGKFDSNSDLEIFPSYSTRSKAYRAYNQNTKFIQESYNVDIDDSNSKKADNSYDLTQESISDIPEIVDESMEILESIPEKVVDPNIDEQPLEITKSSEVEEGGLIQST